MTHVDFIRLSGHVPANLYWYAAKEPITLADVRFSLARAIWDSHGDRAEARSLAAAAEAPLAGSPSELAELHAWQHAHP